MSCHEGFSKDMDLTSKTEGAQDKVVGEGEAVLIVSFASQNNKCNTGRVLECSPEFEKIIQRVQDAGEGPELAVIGITGASPQENLWLMNLFARCLQQLDRPCGDDKMNKESGEMINDYIPVDEQRCDSTEGIWMWSRPFIIRNKNSPSQKLAVLLMTVQGCSDDTALTDEEKQAIFGLTLLTSSSLIVMETGQIDTSTFYSLHKFIQHAREAIKEEFNSTGFQDIAFFIRNGTSPDHRHGLQAGQNYLEKCLEIKSDMSDEEKEYRRCILETFERHRASLVPDSGRPVDEDGWTSVNLMNPDVRDCVQEFIVSTLSNLSPQKILSKLASPSAMNLLISAYLKAFNEAEEESTAMSGSNSQISTWAKSYEEALRNKITSKGAPFLPQEKITKWHRDLKAIYMGLLKNNHDLAAHKKSLEATIEQIFTTISIENETAKLQLEDENRARQDQATALLNKGLEIYIENMDMLCSEGECLSSLYLTRNSNRFMAIALQRIESEGKQVFPHTDRLSEFCSQLNAALCTEFARYEHENTLKLESIEAEMQENVRDAAEIFKGKVSPLLETLASKETFESIAKLHDEILQTCVQALEEIQCPDGPLSRKYRSILKKSLADVKDEARLDLENSLKAIEATCEGLLDASTELITTTLDAILFNGEAQDEQDLEEAIDDAARSISDQLQSDLERTGAQNVKSYFQRLAAFVSTERDRLLEENRKRAEEHMRSQLEKLDEFCNELYLVIVDEYEESIRQNPFMSDDEANVIIAQKLNDFYNQSFQEISKIQAESAQTDAIEELKRRQEDLKIDLKSRMRQIREAGGDERAKLVTSCIQLASNVVTTKLTDLLDPSVEMIDEIIHEARENVHADLKSKSQLPGDEESKALEEILVHLDAEFQKRRQEAITKMEEQEKVVGELVRNVVGHVGSEIEGSFQDGRFYRAEFLDRALQSVDEIHEDFLRILSTEGIQATPKINALFQEKAEERVQSLRVKNEANLQAALHDLANELPQWYKHGLNDIKSNAEFDDLKRQVLQKAYKFVEDKTNFSVHDDQEMSRKIQDVCALSTEKATSQLERDFMRQSMSLLGPAEVTYRQSMDEFIGTNNLPLHPSDLQQFHAHSVRRTLQRLSRQNFVPPAGQHHIQAYLGLVYRKYEERNLLKCADESNDVIGIDLGTTTSCVAIFQHGEARVIKDESGQALNPSWVYFNEEQKPVVGHAAKNEAHIHTEDTVYDAKRLIGRDMNDPNVQKNMKKWLFKVVPGPDGRPRVLVRGKRLEPEEISSRILKKMAEIAEADLEGEVTKAVITVPANFNDRQRGATIQAAQLAGLEVLQIINEPTAAALAYARDWKRLNRTVLVFDFGGGTLDVTILKTAEGDKKAKESLGMQLQVLSTAGDTNLGGEDIDDRLVDHCARKFEAKEGIKLLEAEPDKPTSILGAKRRSVRLRQYCEKAKCNLTAADVTTVAVDNIFGDKNLTIEVTRPEFERICEDLFQRAIDVVQKALEDAKLTAKDIDDVLMVGGSSRIPRMKTLLGDFLGCGTIALNQKIDIQEAVARGAAIQACILNGGKAAGKLPRVKDVQPFSLGIEIIGGDMSVIIPRNSQIPLSIMKQYVTTENNQREVFITIHSGEEQVAKENFLLGQFRLLRIPPGPKGSQEINVEMKIDKSGILNVTATCVSNGATHNIKIEENRGRLTENQLEYLSGRFVH